MVEGDDEMVVADGGGEVELLAGEGEDAVPAEAAGAVAGVVDEGAHEIAEGVEVGLAGEIGACEDGALDEGGGGKDARLAGKEIDSAPWLPGWRAGVGEARRG